MIKQISTISGLFLIALGLLGFVAPHFMGLSLSAGQGALYLSSGCVALYCGLLGPLGMCRMFGILLGSFYVCLGVAGIGLGGPQITIVPGHLVFGIMDSLFHLVLGAVVLGAALSGKIPALMPVLAAPQKLVRIFQHPNHTDETPHGLMPVAKKDRTNERRSRN
jgi:hypothetical protein